MAEQPNDVRFLPDPPPGPGATAPAWSPSSVRVITDYLALGALSCAAPVAAAFRPGPDTGWSAVTYGLGPERHADARPGPPALGLASLIEHLQHPIEVHDLASAVPASRLPYPPHRLRWAVAAPVPAPPGVTAGVVMLLDTWDRQAGPRESRALASLARLVGAQLTTPPADPVMSRATLSRAPGGAGRPRRGSASTGASPLLRSSEVAALFDVSERTVINWARAGRLPSIRTVGGHLRFRREAVYALLDAERS
jgi:excisionase family DNA binding protein